MATVEISDVELAQERERAKSYFDNAIMKRVLARLDRLEAEQHSPKQVSETRVTMSEISDERLAQLKSGHQPCGRCDSCIDGFQCQEGAVTTPAEQQLLERLERTAQELVEAQERISAWQLALHEVVPGFHHDVNPPHTLSPKDVLAAFGVLLEEPTLDI